MTRGTRLMLMVLILIAVVVGMTQCMKKTIKKKKALQEDGRAPVTLIHLA